MKTKTFLALALLLGALGIANGQTSLSSTTLTNAITTTGGSGLVLTLGSTTGMLNQSAQNRYDTCLYIDKELFGVVSVISSTQVSVGPRGSTGCGGVGAALRPTTHAAGAKVYYANNIANGPPFGPITAPQQIGSNASANAEDYGSCTGTNLTSLPRIYLASGDIFNCLSSGQWFKFANGTDAPAGARAASFCSGTVGTAETEYLNYAACSAATTSTYKYVVNNPGTVAYLSVYSSAGVTGGTGKDVLTVYKNGSSTALTCTMAASATTCTDSAHSFSVAAGDVLAFQFVTATSDTAANISASVGIY